MVLEHPIVQAPMGGGPSTPALAAAVGEAGGLGFLAAGYKPVEAVRADIEALRALTDHPFGVNLFAPPAPAADDVAPFAARLEAEAERYGAPVGDAWHDDDGWATKLDLLEELDVPVVSFTFGCPAPEVLARFSEAWVTVTKPDEAQAATAAGATALLVQGVEAGGHRGGFDDGAPGDIGILALLQTIDADLPLIAAGGIASGRGVAAVLAAGASAAALGTAFMLCPEAATAPAHREAIAGDGDTALTRAFTGRLARGVVNRWMREHEPAAPSAYPDVHHLTAKIRAAAREQGDADGFHLWAGQAHALATAEPAGDLVRRLAAEAREAVSQASDQLQEPPAEARSPLP
jgi:nitronate monooxygenase